MNASSPLLLRYAILTVAMAVTLAACAPAGGSGGGSGGGMGGMGGMGSGSSRSGERAGSDEDHGVGEAPPPVPGAEALTVEADEMFFAPDKLRISAGEPVNVTVVNTGDVFHDFRSTRATSCSTCPPARPPPGCSPSIVPANTGSSAPSPDMRPPA